MHPKLKIALAMVIFGTIALFVRGIPLSSAEVALLRPAIALVCLLTWQAVKKRPVRLRGLGRDLPLLFLSGAAMGFNWIFLFEAYRYTTVSVATLSYYFAPVIVTAASPLLFHEKLTPVQIACFVGSTLGLALVIRPDGASAGGQPLTGVAFGLAAAVLYATVVLMNKRIRRISGIDRTVIQFAAAFAVLLPYVLLSTGLGFAAMTPAGWLCLFAVGAIHTAVAYCLYFSGIQSVSGQEASILSYIDPLTAVALSVLVLREPASASQLIGGAMILAFTLVNEIRGR